MQIGNAEVSTLGDGTVRLSVGGTPVSQGLDYGVAITLANLLALTSGHDSPKIFDCLRQYGLNGGIEKC